MLNRYGVHVEGIRAALDGTMFAWYAKFCSRASGNNSVVECDLAKVEVAGSNPVSRSIFVSRTTVLVVTDGAVAKW